ncbi:Oxidoreductase, molybdopterin-binding domain-containing protein [Hygrophoropsis aurantiaca]|uniref:Oxidoreductase, molybdopterin-binding domain-containing protein n=1 Tax=Hygrophoropsis aurantiaca TaxID=72124 RepID=A0ACB8ARW0_9AGAM|nr:Oxidoreductase, molybdopterin-binding domain-containing protein [Hygrophoropsis aurantiaca]
MGYPTHDTTTGLRVLSETPFNAEPPCLVELTKHTITPSHLMYARNHSDKQDELNDSDGDEKVVKVTRKEATFTVKDLMTKYPKKEVVATLICAGNRRAKMAQKTCKPVEGIKWGEGAISNVRWGGVRLRDILLDLEVSETIGLGENATKGSECEEDVKSEGRGQWHVSFASHVAPCEQDSYYGGSIPLEKALDEEGDVILAYEMNNVPLTPGHGYPLRVVVPGYSGMRWVKWVDRITVSRRESGNFYQQKDYKMLPECVTSKAIAESGGWWNRVPAMQALPLNSVVAKVECASVSLPPTLTQTNTYPDEDLAHHVKNLALDKDSSCIEANDNLKVRIRATGYAYSHSRISRVELSADEGTSWVSAKITYQEGRWSWALWEGFVDVRHGLGYDVGVKRGVTVMSRAYDETGRIQDTNCAWNLRGVGFCGAGEGTVVI